MTCQFCVLDDCEGCPRFTVPEPDKNRTEPDKRTLPDISQTSDNAETL